MAARELSLSLQEQGHIPDDGEQYSEPAGKDYALDERGQSKKDWKGDPILLSPYGLEIIWTYEPPADQIPRERPGFAQCIRRNAFHIFLFITFGGTFLVLLITKVLDKPGNDGVQHLGMLVSRQWWNLFKYLSIPVVSIIFTWWHVWLGIQMCFYPVHFRGCCKPVCGWQGIVPRRADIMARRCCRIMIGSLVKIEEIIDRIDPDSFFNDLKDVLANVTSICLETLANKYAPEIWAELMKTNAGKQAKEELKKKCLEEARKMFNDVIEDVKANFSKIVDTEQMAVDILTNDRELLVEIFREIGDREFTFIQHFSAVLGFLCGVLQMVIWMAINENHEEDECKNPNTKGAFHCWAGFLILPVSGLLIGYVTNWLGINLIFRPVWPHLFCNRYVNFQGVFLKRQPEVSEKMSQRICSDLVTAEKMLDYVLQKEEKVQKVVDMFQENVEKVIKKQAEMGLVRVASMAAGPDRMAKLTTAAGQEMLSALGTVCSEGMNKKKIEEYMNKKFNLAKTMSHRLSRLPPDQFEGMLHPVFQEDEWMVLLLGGVLGVTVGTLQAFALGS